MLERLPAEYYGHDFEDVRRAISTLFDYNNQYRSKHGIEYFQNFISKQSPRATIVACSDSRVQMNALDPFPENDLFVVRNIGNQFATAEGSVEYGVRHLHTPLLMILGHVRCGAIEAACSDYSCESDPIRAELDTLHIDMSLGSLGNVLMNVRRQVAAALREFDAEVRTKKLLVVGAVYDFADDLQRGHGKLVITDLNNISQLESGSGQVNEFLSR